MQTLEKVLKGFQGLLIIVGFGFMYTNFANTYQLTLPETIYDEQELLRLILNAAQGLGLFAGALALGALHRTFWK